MVWIYFLVGISIGVAVGVVAAALISGGKEVGTLCVTFAEKGEAPLLFCELKTDLLDVRKRKKVVLRVKEQKFYT